MNAAGERLFAFDMDGTLLPGTTGLIELAKALRSEDMLQALEAEFSAGRLDTVAFTRKVSALWGPISEEVARAAFDNAPKLAGITEVTGRIRDMGGISCVVTMSQDVFAARFLDFGFDHVIATPYPPHHANDFSRVLKPADKITVLRRLAGKYGFDFAGTVAFGDSLSDVELFSQISHSVAVNGDHHLSEYAAYSYCGGSILEAFEHSEYLWSSV